MLLKVYPSQGTISNTFIHNEPKLENMSEDTKRGLLTKKEQEYLRTGDSGGSNPRKLRQNIRERVRQGIADFALLYEQMEDRDITQAVDVSSGEFYPDFRNSYVSTIGFLFRLADQCGVEVEPLIWEGIHDAHNRTHIDQVADIDLSIDSKPRDQMADDVREKISLGQTLTDIELRFIFENPVILNDTIERYIRRRREMLLRKLVSDIHENPELIEEGLEILDDELQLDTTAPDPELPRTDLIGRDRDDKIVLLNTTPGDLGERQYEALDENMSDLINEYGGEERVRGIIVVLSSLEQLPDSIEDSNVEYVSLLDQLDTAEDMLPKS